MAQSKKRSILKKALKGPMMSRENPEILTDYKMKNMMDDIDIYKERMEDKEDRKQGIIRNKVTRQIVGKIQTY
jgi:hypothetical protein